METALENSVWVISPEFAGYLTKRGFHWRKLWKKRWVALHGSEIAYMAEEPNDSNTDDLIVTKAQITSATVVDREDLDGHPHGFAIHINDGVSPTWYLRADSTREKKSWLMRLGHVHTIVRWLEEFEKVRVLGVGGTGIVYELLHNANGQRYAMKEMEIKNKSQMQMAVAEAEMLKEIMENISHPNIMHIEKVFQVGAKFYLVFPLCTGGELYEHVIRRGHFTEFDAAKLMRDLISALHELHRHDILHLDIKPENIIFDSDAEDARIKLTDFGLSKVFHNATKSSTGKNPSLEELNQKLKAFQDSGVLQRDRLRGTVGYMSPELILAGVSSRATDVWAAGVVLYILLCGRPPFQSKSNRDILEKSARGDYSLDGKEWDGITADAKDLVRRMLTVDPEKRITTGEILAHPWICMVSEEASFLAGTATPQREQFARSKQTASNSNLNSALRALSNHVHEQRFEKMATNFTRLVSILQQNSGDKLVKYLNHPDDTGDDPIDDSSTSSPILSLEIRDALVNVFKELGGEDNGGKLTIEQFTQVLTHFGYGGKDGLVGGGGIMLICRFIDSDGDGLISPEDLFLAEARILQRSPQFLRAIFRVYTEAVWYPGRQLNHLSIQRATAKAGNRQNGILGDNSNDGGDIVEPPKFITGRNVAAVFERLGYNPDAGTKLFGALCEALARKRAQTGRSVSNCTEGQAIPADPLPPPVVTPSPTPPRPALRNAALSAIVGGITDTVAALSMMPSSSKASQPMSPAAVQSSEEISQQQSAGAAGGGPGAEGGAGEGSEGKNYRMDIQDFIDACEIDDVLLEVIQLKPRSRMKKLMQKSVDSFDQSMNSSMAAEQLRSNSGESSSSPERVNTESGLGEHIAVEFKKALANRRPSST